jgi:hypothetical protein
MIFGHIPAGYLVSQIFVHTSWRKFTSKQRNLLILLTSIFAAAPDLDFLYFYLVSAENMHRQYITHSPIPYAILLLIFIALGKAIKSPFLCWIGGAMFFGVTLGHLLMDSLYSGVMWLYPIDKHLIGFRSANGSEFSFFQYKGASLLFLFEIVISTTALIVFTRQFLKKHWSKWIGYSVSFFFFTSAFISITLAAPHLASTPFAYYSDYDRDGVINGEDRDMDNDDIRNSLDEDTDGDGIKNTDDFVAAAKNLTNLFYDPYRGRFLNMSKYAGFVTGGDIVSYALAQSGYFLSSEIKKDFALHPERYTEKNGKNSFLLLNLPTENNTPKNDPLFAERLYNMFIFFQNSPFQPREDTNFRTGDIVFFIKKGSLTSLDSNRVKHVAIIVECPPIHNGVCAAISAHPSFRSSQLIDIQTLLLSELVPEISTPYSFNLMEKIFRDINTSELPLPAQ